MIPLYVINLKRQTERRELMSAHLEGVGISPIWVDAVDAQCLNPDEQAAFETLDNWGPWGVVSNHAKGCTLSHLKALRSFLSSSEPYGCILEDDVFVSRDLANWLGDTAWLDAQVEVVKLERWRDNKLLVMLGPVKSSYRGRALRPLYSKHSGAAGYIVSRVAAEAIVRDTRINVPFDHFLFHPNVSRFAKQSRVLQVVPALIVQGNEPINHSKRPRTNSGSILRFKQAWARGFAELHFVLHHVFNLLIRRAWLRKIDWRD